MRCNRFIAETLIRV